MNPSAVLQRAWLSRGPMACCLLPLALIFKGLVALRRSLYRGGWLSTERLPVPVIVVGGITVGGSGKTPLILWLVENLRRRGLNPGIVSRGYGGNGQISEVGLGSDSAVVGDEPLMLKRRTLAPVFVGRDRVAAARALLAAHPQCQLILADDGLQHYRLYRDMEIAVLDGRGLMNAWPLPAGPLREPQSRLRRVDALVINGSGGETVDRGLGPARFAMRLVGASFHALDDPQRRCAAADLANLHLAAIAGIGDPARFFEHLRQLGIRCSGHPFADHHLFSAEDLAKIEADALLMTEKDAVKCAGLTDRPVWVLPVGAEVEPDLASMVMEKLYGRSPA